MSFFRPILILDESGVWYFNRFISSWDNIDFVQFSRIKNQKRAKEIIDSIPQGTSTNNNTALRATSVFGFIVIYLNNYDEYYNKLNFINKLIYNENKKLMGSGINLNPMEIKASKQEIIDAFKQFNCKII